MPASLTIFAAKDLVFVAAFLAAVVLFFLLRSKSRPALLRWAITAVLILGLSYVFAKIGAALYTDPRPFTVDHVKPLISHAPDNGFPSDHALLAGAIVALVALVSLWWALPFVVLAVLVDWGRVGSGVHHVSDVVGSSVFVALATVVALIVVHWLSPYLPAGESARREMVSPAGRQAQ